MAQWIGDKWTGDPPQVEGPRCPDCEKAHVGVDGYCLFCYPPHKRYEPPKVKEPRHTKKPGTTRLRPTKLDERYYEERDS
jgi:hypothetical protein